MFLKLVKHELFETFRLLPPVYGGLLLMAGLARGSIALLERADSPALRVVGVTLIIFFYLSCAAAVVLTAVFLILRFSRSVYGDEGYLTNTLPAGVHSILLSRLLVSVLAILFSCAVVYGSIRLCLVGLDLFSGFGEILEELFRRLDLDLDSTILRWAVMALLGVLALVLRIFAAIAIGHSFNRSKAGMSVLFYFVLSIGTSMVSNLINVVLLSSQMLSSDTSLSQITDMSVYSGIAVSLVSCGVYYFLTWIMTRKKLNL